MLLFTELDGAERPTNTQLQLAHCAVETVLFIANEEGSSGKDYPDFAKTKKLYVAAYRAMTDSRYEDAMQRIYMFRDLREWLTPELYQ